MVIRVYSCKEAPSSLRATASCSFCRAWSAMFMLTFTCTNLSITQLRRMTSFCFRACSTMACCSAMVLSMSARYNRPCLIMSGPLNVGRCGTEISTMAGGRVPGAGFCPPGDPGCASATGPISNDNQMSPTRLDIRDLAS